AEVSWDHIRGIRYCSAHCVEVPSAVRSQNMDPIELTFNVLDHCFGSRREQGAKVLLECCERKQSESGQGSPQRSHRRARFRAAMLLGMRGNQLHGQSAKSNAAARCGAHLLDILFPRDRWGARHARRRGVWDYKALCPFATIVNASSNLGC